MVKSLEDHRIRIAAQEGYRMRDRGFARPAPISRRALLGQAIALGAGAALTGFLEADRRRAASTAWAAPAGAAGPGRWVAKASLPFPRTEVSAAGLDGRVYLIGGYAHGRVDQPFNQVYDPVTNMWRDLAPMPRGVNHVGIVGYNGRIYAFGGFIEQNRNAIADCYEYHVQENRWRRIAPLPSKRGAMSVVELGGKLHLVGGRDEFSVGNHEVYDPQTDAWSSRAPLRDGRDHVGLVVVAGKIHVIGGRFNTFANNTDLHEVYDPATDRWEYRRPLPTARSGVGAAVLAGRIFVIGGETTGRVFPENEAYDPATDRWVTMAPMATPRHGTGAVTVGDAIYMPGGGLTVGGSMPSATHEAFTLA
jgi:N-acetylneuraminic acid mutarotase